jgi:hypothetical protein
MTPSKMIMADKFINALIEAGLVGDRTATVTIKATCGEPIYLDYECLGDERLLNIVGAIEVVDDEAAA